MNVLCMHCSSKHDLYVGGGGGGGGGGHGEICLGRKKYILTTRGKDRIQTRKYILQITSAKGQKITHIWKYPLLLIIMHLASVLFCSLIPFLSLFILHAKRGAWALLPRVCMRKAGLSNWFCLSVSVSVSQSECHQNLGLITTTKGLCSSHVTLHTFFGTQPTFT